MQNLSQTRLVLAALIVAAAAYYAGKSHTNPAPAPRPAPRGPDLVSVFAANQDKQAASQHAEMFGTICDKVAATLEVDSRRGDQRRIATGIDVAKYRSDLRFYTTSGWSFSSHYPALRTQVEAWLDAEAGRDPKQLDDAATQRWIEAFRGLAAAAHHAAKRMQ